MPDIYNSLERVESVLCDILGNDPVAVDKALRFLGSIGKARYDDYRGNFINWEERLQQSCATSDAWRKEAEEAWRKARIAEQQRDEALSQAKGLQKEVDLLQGSPYLHGLRRISELKSLSLPTLKSLQAQLRSDLDEIDKVIYMQTATKCMVCQDANRSVTLVPCNHFVLCSKCATSQKECPYCQTPCVAQTSNMPL